MTNAIFPPHSFSFSTFYICCKFLFCVYDSTAISEDVQDFVVENEDDVLANTENVKDFFVIAGDVQNFSVITNGVYNLAVNVGVQKVVFKIPPRSRKMSMISLHNLRVHS